MIVGMGLALGWDSDLARGRANRDFLSNNCRSGTRHGLGQRLGERMGKQGVSFQIIVGMRLALGWDSDLRSSFLTLLIHNQTVDIQADELMSMSVFNVSATKMGSTNEQLSKAVLYT